MFDDAGARIYLSGFPRRSYSPWQAGVKDLGFPVIMISCHNDAAGGECMRSEEHTSELQSLRHLVCRLLLEKTKKKCPINTPHGRGLDDYSSSIQSRGH